jgi:spore photoproduct lyase
MNISKIWRPSEIIINNKVKDDPATLYVLNQCPGVPVKYVGSGKSTDVVSASDILRSCAHGMLDKVIAGKQVVFIAPAGTAVDQFTMPDSRMFCPHFDRLKLASNGCFYKCDWCYLKLTYRAAHPFITIRVQHEKIKKQIQKRLDESTSPVMFNSGELADSLSMEHLTGAMRKFIPWLGRSNNGYLFLLTKSDNVDDILDLPHNGHSIMAWSMNNDVVSRTYEIGAPGFERRLEAAYKVQQAGYPLRIRIDPIVPFDGWQSAYADTVTRIFRRILPERVTLGTLRFEDGFHKMRNSIFTTGPELPTILQSMIPMFDPKVVEGSKRPKVGKFSYREEKRIEIFDFMIREIRKHSQCTIALCKESANVWNQLGMDLSRCRCACQLDYADMSEQEG